MSKGDMAAAVLERSGLGAVARRRPLWRGVLLLNHHRVGDGTRWSTGRDVWSATAEQLDDQLSFLSRHFDLVGPEQIEDVLRDPRARAVGVTFDDGYRECYDIAYPILRRYGLSALFFLTTGFLDGIRTAWWDEITWMVGRSERAVLPADGWLRAPVPLSGPSREASIASLLANYKTLSGQRAEDFLDYLAEATASGRRDPATAQSEWLTWDMVREMCRGGMSMGAHTVNHPVLARQSLEAQRSEIAGSLERIAEETGKRPVSFSYPDGTRGSFDDTARALLEHGGVRFGFSNYGGIAQPGSWDPYDIPRISLGHQMTRHRFRGIATLPLQLHYH
jgi:peptidoglycan/xylan/chitin deacetylase (PgdA/CDA1 family)